MKDPASDRSPGRRMRWAVGVGLVGVAAAAGLGVLVQSPLGFQRLAAPLAARALGADLTATWGRVGLDGSLRARGLSLHAPAWGLSAEIGEVELRVDPRSLFGGATPRIRRAMLRDAHVRWGDGAESESASEAPLDLALPVFVDALVWDGGSLVVGGEENTSLSLHGVRLGMRDLAPGAKGVVFAIANAQIAPDRARSAADGVLRLDLAVPVETSGAWSWDGTAAARVRALHPDAVIGDVVAFTVGTSGAVALGPTLDVRLKLAASQDDTPLGVVDAHGGYVGGVDGGVTLDLGLHDLGPAFINPLLAVAAPVQLARGRVEGRIEARTEAGEVAYTAALDGEDVVLTPTDGGASPAPVRLTLRQRGAVAWSGERLQVAEAHLAVDDARRRLVTAGLAEPLVLTFGANRGDAPTARVTVEIDDVPLSTLRPWVALSGSDALGGLDKGNLAAAWLATVEAEGERVRITGGWSLVNATTPGPDGRGPFGVRHDLDLSFVDFERLTVEPKTAHVTLAGRELLTLAPRLTYVRSTGALDLAAPVAVPDGPEALRQLGLMPGALVMRDGRFAGTASASRAGSATPLALALALEGGPVRLLDAGGRTVGRHGMKIDLKGARAASGAELTLADSVVTILDQGATPAQITLSGHWPQKASAPRDGRIGIAVRGLDARSWGEMLGYVAAGALSSLPLEGDLVLERPRAGTAVRVMGTERLGPLSPALDPKRRAGPVTLRVTHDGTYTGSAMEGLEVNLVAEQQRGAGEVALVGRVALGTRTYTQLKGTASNVDLSPWVALYLGPDSEAEPTPGASLDFADTFDFAIPVDLDVALALAKCVYFDLPIDEGTLTLVGRGGDLAVRLDAPKAAGGQVTLRADLMVGGRRPGITWSADVKDADVGALITALRWGRPAPLTARGSFATSGRGDGVRRAIGRSLDGAFTFDLTKGQLGDAGVLDYLARQTGVWAFQRMGFDQLMGKLVVEDGTLRLEHGLARNVEAKLAAGGVIYDGAAQAWRINPRVDEATWKLIAPKFQAPAFRGDDGYYSLPIDVVIGGSWAKPRYSVGPREGLAEQAAGSILQEIDDRTGLGVGGMIGDVLGIPAPAPAPVPEPEPAPGPRPKMPARPAAEGGK